MKEVLDRFRNNKRLPLGMAPSKLLVDKEVSQALETISKDKTVDMGLMISEAFVKGGLLKVVKLKEKLVPLKIGTQRIDVEPEIVAAISALGKDKGMDISLILNDGLKKLGVINIAKSLEEDSVDYNEKSIDGYDDTEETNIHTEGFNSSQSQGAM